ncbi:MAG: sulfite exporter TauE/SafE family protein [Synechococcus sp.]
MTALMGLAFLTLGLFVGTLSGTIGIGGGVLITPALIYLFGFTQHQAQGTTLALLVPPIGLLGALTYYRHGFVDLQVVVPICLGFLVGGLIGAKFAMQVPGLLLRRVFGTAMLALSLRMIFSR